MTKIRYRRTILIRKERSGLETSGYPACFLCDRGNSYVWRRAIQISRPAGERK
ncbi:hypothetical protein CLOHYLEM_04890 [[Clostridium] hylemonae DSM 15053]|uniref:Uncharacterized protein n=1 Tax=[Clostridium] hylemonae DSM 15053 TaxID=553973 RepID=C0BYK1_9FIRM|nr:hypothetical protein CLOHYLEM_04890 [[Clostridium] hylemonae DSM 15053]